MKTMPIALLTLIAALFATGCASTLPRNIGQAPAGDPSVTMVRADITGHVGQAVRWGGTIIDVNNDEESSQLEIIARELRRDGRPGGEDSSPGRFIAEVDGFLDPAIFAIGRDITVFGPVTGELRGELGSRTYSYPVVQIQEYQLWRRSDARDYPPGYRVYYYDSFYPWGGYYYPYYRPWPPQQSLPSRPSILRNK